MKRFVALTLAVLLAFAVMASAAALDSPGPKEYYYISFGSEGSGTTTADVNRVEKNSDGTVTLTAENDLGYFTRWIIDGDFELVDGTLEDPVIVIRPKSDIDAKASYSVEEDYLNITVEQVTDGQGYASVDIPRVLKGSDTVVTLTATEVDDEFVEWQLFCDYTIVEGSMTTKVLKIIPLTDIRAVAYFKSVPAPKPDDGKDSPKTGDALPYVVTFMVIALGAVVLASKKLKKAE